MARDDPHFRLRIPFGLKAAIERDAAANRRSINAEILDRVSRTVRQENGSPYLARIYSDLNTVDYVITAQEDVIREYENSLEELQRRIVHEEHIDHERLGQEIARLIEYGRRRRLPPGEAPGQEGLFNPTADDEIDGLSSEDRDAPA